MIDPRENNMTAEEQLVQLHTLALDMASELEHLGLYPGSCQFAGRWAVEYRERIAAIVPETTTVTLTVKLTYVDGAEGESILDVLIPQKFEAEVGLAVREGLEPTPALVSVSVIR